MHQQDFKLVTVLCVLLPFVESRLEHIHSTCRINLIDIKALLYQNVEHLLSNWIVIELDILMDQRFAIYCGSLHYLLSGNLVLNGVCQSPICRLDLYLLELLFLEGICNHLLHCLICDRYRVRTPIDQGQEVNKLIDSDVI